VFARNQQYDCVKLLLDHGANPNAPGMRMPQIFCALGSRFDRTHVDARVLELLIERGADMNVMFEGQSVWTHAVTEGFPEIMEVLIRRGADVNASHPECGTVLHLAVKSDTEAAEVLL
jgi:ankyrin repeat protein